MGKRVEKKAHKSFLKGFYWFIFSLAMIILVVYVALSFFVKAPDVTPPPIIPPPAVSTDNPDTDADETIDPATGTALTRKEQFHTFLLMGTDDGNGNADTIMVASYDVKNQTVGVASIPRDTLVNVKRTVKKINGAYGSGGIDQVKEEVSKLVGFQLDHYIAVDIRAFQKIVDIVGGIDFDVPQNMYHNDGAGFVINLKKGMQHLTGHQALELVRFRGYANADIGRVAVQQQFLTAMAKKVLSWNSATKIKDFVDVFSTHVKTDLTVGNLAYFAIEALDLNHETGVTLSTLPGDGLVTYKGIPYYYELFPTETLAIINDTLNPFTTDITLEMANIFQVP